MAMVFTLVTTLKDSAELLIVERQKAIEAQQEMKAAEAEAEENRKFEGTKVTRETFLEWSARFKQEMEDEARRKEQEREEERRGEITLKTGGLRGRRHAWQWSSATSILTSICGGAGALSCTQYSRS